MFKKTLLAFMIASVCCLVITTGCSKSENAVACGSILSASGVGAFFLKKHFKRSQLRKHELFNFKYTAKVIKDEDKALIS